MTSPDFEIKFSSVRVYANEGPNILELRGTGKSDGFGLTVDNVKLVKEGTA
jgi:hypothetical protein